MKNQNKKKNTEHHIIPLSRQKGKGILNVCNVPLEMHNLYHQLFGTMTPDEIIIYLNEKFWGNVYSIKDWRT